MNGGEKFTCVSGDGEEKIIVVEQPKRDRKLPFTYFGMQVDTFGSEFAVNHFAPKETVAAKLNADDINVERKVKNNGKETQLVSVELTLEEPNEDFVLEFLSGNVINVVYKNTFAYASQLIEEVQHEYYSEEDAFPNLEEEDDFYMRNNR